MEHRKRAVRSSTATRPALYLLLFLCIWVSGGRAAAQSNTAVVTGTQRVFVRRGAGTEFPAFATLERGSVVEVQ